VFTARYELDLYIKHIALCPLGQARSQTMNTVGVVASIALAYMYIRLYIYIYAV
jgi:hypothetical protein